MDETALPVRQQVFIILVGVFILLVVIELIRKRKLLEQYAAIWLVLGLLAVSCVWLYPWIFWLTHIIGAGFTTSTILFFAVFVAFMLIMQLCIKISEQSHQIKDLAQEVTLLKYELEETRSGKSPAVPREGEPIHISQTESGASD